MEAIANLPYKVPSDFFPQTLAAFYTLLEKNRDEIESVKRETLRYGSTERHKLDIFYPPNAMGKVPIIVFTYGGAFQTGDRDMPFFKGLVYANIAAFFAKQGYLVVTADYRLSPIGEPDASKYPDASIDIKDAISFIVSNDRVNKVADTGRIYLLGHSVGGLIQATLVLHPTILPDDLRSRIKGGIFNGAIHRMSIDPAPGPFKTYYDIEGEKDTPYTIVEASSDSRIKSFPPMMFINAEKELDEPLESSKDIVKLLKEREFSDVTEYSCAGHNHVSGPLALLSGEGEEWGHEVVRWIKAH